MLGTEAGKLLLLNSAGTAVAHSVTLGSPPAFLAAAGGPHPHTRISVATRDGRLHLLKGGQPDPHPVHLETPAVGLVGGGARMGGGHGRAVCPAPNLARLLLAAAGASRRRLR